MQTRKSNTQVGRDRVDRSAYTTAVTDAAPADDGRGSVTTFIHPHVFVIGLGAVLWFLAVTWLDFAWDRQVDADLFVVTGFFVFFFGLLLIAYNEIAKDPRWGGREMGFKDFLHTRVSTYTGMWRGRDVLVGITLIPICLALGATLIGLASLGVRLWQ
jgi:hypothetical protein